MSGWGVAFRLNQPPLLGKLSPDSPDGLMPGRSGPPASPVSAPAGSGRPCPQLQQELVRLLCLLSEQVLSFWLRDTCFLGFL